MAEWWQILYPDNPIAIALIIAIVVGGALAIRFFVRFHEPPGKRMDRVILYLPTLGHIIRGVAYEHQIARDVSNFELLREVPEARGIADIIIQHKNKMFFYLIKYETMTDSALENGMGLLIMHQRIDDPELGERSEAHFDLLRMGRTHTRTICQASEYGRIFKNKAKYQGKDIDIIYYPAMKTKVGETENVHIDNPFGVGVFIARMEEAVLNTEMTNRLKAENSAMRRNLGLSESEIARQVGRAGLMEIENSKKSPIEGKELTQATALSAVMVFLIILGSILVFPSIIGYIMPAIDVNTKYQVSAVIGGIIVFVFQYFRR